MHLTRILSLSLSSLLPLRLAPRPEYSFDDVVLNIRQRAAAVGSEQQLTMLLTQIVQGLEVRPPPPVDSAAAASAAAAAAGTVAASSAGPRAPAISSAQISDLIQQLKSGQITQQQLYSRLSSMQGGAGTPVATAPTAPPAPSAPSAADLDSRGALSSSDRRNMLEAMVRRDPVPTPGGGGNVTQPSMSLSSISAVAAPASATVPAAHGAGMDTSLWNALGSASFAGGAATGGSSGAMAGDSGPQLPFNTSFRSTLSYVLARRVVCQWQSNNGCELLGSAISYRLFIATRRLLATVCLMLPFSQ